MKRQHITKTALFVMMLALALTVNVALAHAGHGHEDQSTGWLGRLDDVGLAGGILLAFGVVYWLSNRNKEGWWLERPGSRDDGEDQS